MQVPEPEFTTSAEVRELWVRLRTLGDESLLSPEDKELLERWREWVRTIAPPGVYS